MPWSFRVISKLKDEKKRAESIWTYYLGICLKGLKEKHDMETWIGRSETKTAHNCLDPKNMYLRIMRLSKILTCYSIYENDCHDRAVE